MNLHIGVIRVCISFNKFNAFSDYPHIKAQCVIKMNKCGFIWQKHGTIVVMCLFEGVVIFFVISVKFPENLGSRTLFIHH